MKDRQLNAQERSVLAALRTLGLSQAGSPGNWAGTGARSGGNCGATGRRMMVGIARRERTSEPMPGATVRGATASFRAHSGRESKSC